MTDQRSRGDAGDGLAPMDEPPGGGCGVQGCLIAAVALFVILLIALLIISVIRFSSPPQPRFGDMLPGDGTTVLAVLACSGASRNV